MKLNSNERFVSGRKGNASDIVVAVAPWGGPTATTESLVRINGRTGARTTLMRDIPSDSYSIGMNTYYQPRTMTMSEDGTAMLFLANEATGVMQPTDTATVLAY